MVSLSRLLLLRLHILSALGVSSLASRYILIQFILFFLTSRMPTENLNQGVTLSGGGSQALVGSSQPAGWGRGLEGLEGTAPSCLRAGAVPTTPSTTPSTTPAFLNIQDMQDVPLIFYF